MRQERKYRVSLRVHKAVARYISNNFDYVGGAYDLSKSDLYYFVTNMLTRSNVSHPSHVPKRYDTFVPIYILVTESDFYRYGWKCPPLQQWKFSKLILSLILLQGCQMIAMKHIVSGVSRDAAYKEWIYENNFTDDEISYEYIRKYYYRHYLSKEAEIKNFVKKK